MVYQVIRIKMLKSIWSIQYQTVNQEQNASLTDREHLFYTRLHPTATNFNLITFQFICLSYIKDTVSQISFMFLPNNRIHFEILIFYHSKHSEDQKAEVLTSGQKLQRSEIEIQSSIFPVRENADFAMQLILFSDSSFRHISRTCILVTSLYLVQLHLLGYQLCRRIS